jgi:hypothetical protein
MCKCPSRAVACFESGGSSWSSSSTLSPWWCLLGASCTWSPEKWTFTKSRHHLWR